MSSCAARVGVEWSGEEDEEEKGKAEEEEKEEEEEEEEEEERRKKKEKVGSRRKWMDRNGQGFYLLISCALSAHSVENSMLATHVVRDRSHPGF